MSDAPSCAPDELALLLEKCRSMSQLLQAHALILKSGLTHRPSLHAKLLTLAALRSWGSLHHARSLFAATPPAAAPLVCDPMIRAYSRSISPLAAVPVYNLMCRRRIPPSPFTFPFLLKACARAAARDAESADAAEPSPLVSLLARKGSEIHCRLVRLGFEHDDLVRNSLMSAYSQCGRIQDARKLFDETTRKTAVSWNVMLAAYNRLGDHGTTDEIFRSMPEKNVSSWNTMINRYVRTGDIAAASKIFDEMQQRDAISWNSMIAGYIHVRSYRRALELFKQMQASNIKPTELTIVSVLGACAETSALDHGCEIHSQLKRNSYRIEGYVANALLDMYAKCGSLIIARQLFDAMGMKHVTCWNAMIVALAIHGHSEEALELFARMESEAGSGGASPNGITFLGVLIACSHKGLLNEGQSFFKRMTKEYNIKPSIKHYGCMVDLLSRCGLLEEAFVVIKEMPMRANGVVWKTVLSACRVHANVELAEKAFRELAELGPLSDAEYVLMSNIYAEAGRWEDVGRLRTGSPGCNVSKLPGCSQIELT